MNNSNEEVLIGKQKEMLIVMTALSFIEQNALMTQAQLNVARRSLQALFIRTSGEETMLRKLIEILKVNKDLHEAFSSISKISASISTSVEIISKKINYLKQYISRLQLTPQENSEFFAPFLSFVPWWYVMNPAEVMATKWVDFYELCADVARHPAEYTPWLRIYLQEHSDKIFGDLVHVS